MPTSIESRLTSTPDAGTPSGASPARYSNSCGGGPVSAGAWSHSVSVLLYRLCGPCGRGAEVAVGMVRAEVDEVAGVDRRGDRPVAAAPGEQRVVEHAEQVDVLDAAGADRTDGVRAAAVEDHREAGEVVVDDLLDDDVGLVEPGLRPGAGRRCRSSPPVPAGRPAGSSNGVPSNGFTGPAGTVVVVGGSASSSSGRSSSWVSWCGRRGGRRGAWSSTWWSGAAVVGATSSPSWWSPSSAPRCCTPWRRRGTEHETRRVVAAARRDRLSIIASPRDLGQSAHCRPPHILTAAAEVVAAVLRPIPERPLRAR